VAFVMLDRDGSVLVTTGPVRPSDSRLRRAQAVSVHTGAAMPIARRLIADKLAAQGRVVRELLEDRFAEADIAAAIDALDGADTPAAIRSLEARAALAYWSAWRDVPVTFPRADAPRVPDHWRTFGARRSPLTNSPRLAVNPPNAMLNYLYAVLEAEARLAAAALGLDPGLGILHADTDARDSLACDLMEPIRPQIDAYVLNWLRREPLQRAWLFEQRDGNCRLMAALAMRLAETAPAWQRAVAPVAEWVAASVRQTGRANGPQHQPTLLTQQHRRSAKGTALPVATTPKPPHVCHGCGVELDRSDHDHCRHCGRTIAREVMIRVAEQGRAASHTPEAESRRADAMRRNTEAARTWRETAQSAWITERVYLDQIQPRLVTVKVAAIVAALRVSKPYAANVRAGRRRPHRRHWLALARLADVRGPAV
jgi:CRISPR-associated endonuclease Cas1